MVFPEGTRNHSPGVRDLLPCKKGAFTAAIAGQVPVLPVVFQHYQFLDTKSKILDPGHIQVSILNPIETRGLTAEDADDLAEKTRNLMLEELQRL